MDFHPLLFLGIVLFAGWMVVCGFFAFFLQEAMRKRAGEKWRTYKRLADKYGGLCDPPSLYEAGSLELPWKGTTLLLTNVSMSGDGNDTTRIEADFPDPELELEITTVDPLLAMAQSFGMTSRVMTGVKWFDGRFQLTTNSPKPTLGFLSPRVIETLKKIRALRWEASLRIEIRQGQMKIDLGCVLVEFEKLDLFLALATDLLMPMSKSSIKA